MAKPFATYTYDDAIALFGARVSLTSGSAAARVLGEHSIQPSLTNPVSFQRRTNSAKDATAYFSGDHWLDARGFIGQLPPATVPFASAIIADIKAAFVTENVIQEVVETHTGGILGREPTWGFLNAEGKLAKGDNSTEAQAGVTLTPWWNVRKALRDLQGVVKTLVCEGRVVRRVFFPRALNGQITAASLPEALKSIYVSHVTADVAGVFTDEDSQQQIGIFLFDEHDSEGKVIGKAAELSFLNEAGDTVCRVVRDNKRQSTDFPPYQLGGHLLLYELERTPLITDQVQSNQRALNLAHTMMMRNVNLAGSRERIITNAKPPEDVVGQDVHSASRKRVPGRFKVGPGATNYVQGWAYYSDDGNNIVGYTDPNVQVIEPVQVDNFVKTADHYRQAIYSQCHQRHVLIVDKADTSGRAREVARREFERSLKETKALVDASGRWQLEVALRLAAYVIGQQSTYLPLRADFNCLIDAGEPDPEKQKTVLELRQPGGQKGQPLISDETARAWIGVEDPAAELVVIETEANTTSPADNPAAVGTAVRGQRIQQPTQEVQ